MGNGAMALQGMGISSVHTGPLNVPTFFAPARAPSNNGVEEEMLEGMLARKIQEAAKHFPKTVLEILDRDGVYLCGGSLIDTIDGFSVKDYDFFFTNQSALDWTLTRSDDQTRVESRYAITVNNMQFIRSHLFADVNSIFAKFDFTTVQIAFDGKDVHFGPNTIRDLYNKTVSINNIDHPFKALRRLLKFAKRGYACDVAYDGILVALKHSNIYEIAHSEKAYI